MKVHQAINEFMKGYQHTFSMIWNNKGELAMNTKEGEEIWKEYVDKLLTQKNQWNSLK